MHPANFSRGDVLNADVDSIESVVELVSAGRTQLNISFVVGSANLTAFEVAFRYHESGDWVVVAETAGDYTSLEGPIIGCSGDLTTAAQGSSIHFLNLDVRGTYSTRIRAAGSSSSITGHYGMSS